MSVRINYDLCESSGCCEAVCPEDVFEVADGTTRVTNAAACTYCWKCVENCTSGAVELD